MKNVHTTPLNANLEVDASGHDCPVPLLMTKQAAKRLAPGQVLRVLSTDEHTGLDLEAWCLRFGHELAHQRIIGTQHEYWIVIGQKQP